MIVGGYTLELYCDNEEAHPNNWYDSVTRFPLTYAEDGPKSYFLARKYARKAGWVLRRDGTCTCPRCNLKQPTGPYAK